MLIDWFTVAAQLINFAILVWLLKRLLYRRVLEAIDKRQLAILEDAQKAEGQRERAEREAQTYSDRLASFEDEYAEKKLATENELREFRATQLSKARNEVQAQLQSWHESLDRQKHDFSLEFETLVGDRICEISRKMVRDLANVSLEEQMLLHLVCIVVENESKRSAVVNVLHGEEKALQIVTSFPVGDETAHKVRRELASILPSGSKIQFAVEAEASGRCGVVIRAGSHRFEWNVDAYTRQLRESVARALRADVSQQKTDGSEVLVST